ncbi:MAG: hypothetical protein CMF49_08525 [Legionellales bacterium]|nr:hypothetical protein [Legionellales bacterium]|tara:strand:- start:1373 stop:2440 length:1068 start_codon:yes stop_codon:yes gene_type:complete
MQFNFKKRKQINPNKENLAQVNYAPSKRYFPKMKWYLILLIAASPLIYFISHILYKEINIIAPGYVIYDKLVIKTQGQGIVSNILVEVSEDVETSQMLMKLSNNLVNLQIAQMQQQLQLLNTRKKDQYHYIMQQLYEKQKIAKSTVKFANEQLDIVNRVAQQGEAGLIEQTNARGFLANAYYQLRDINIQIAKEKDKYLIDEKSPEGYISEEHYLNDELKKLLLQKKILEIKSPASGMIISLLVSKGEFVTKGQSLLILATNKAPYIISYLSPKFSKYVKKGKTVMIKFSNGEKVKGVIREQPQLTSKIPDSLNSPLETRRIQLVVTITPKAPLNYFNHIDGVPVEVYFPRFSVK